VTIDDIKALQRNALVLGTPPRKTSRSERTHMCSGLTDTGPWLSAGDIVVTYV
jgi:hypothetical protein